MKSIAWINIEIPSSSDEISYHSNASLLDYDLIAFKPGLSYYDTIQFSGGGSCVSIDDTKSLLKAQLHWSRELKGALTAGKTVFIVLDEYEERQAATGATLKNRNQRTYQTTILNNYAPIPINISVRNACGRRIQVKDSNFKTLYETIKGICEYRVVLDAPTAMRTIFTAKDGTPIGGILKSEEWSGSVVLIPFFDFSVEELVDGGDEGGPEWTEKALGISHAFVNQLIAVDRMLKSSAPATPPPEWLSGFAKPRVIDEIEGEIAKIDAQIDELRLKREEQVRHREEMLAYSHLLYESGKLLESAIEKVLRIIGYNVDTLRIDELEIDHVIVGPNKFRMIGESEGKDSSAIDIGKFRQLESNIGEDFEREEVSEPAKGLLFGNGFRLSSPAERAEQFTQKSLINAARLGSALIRTADLYSVAVYVLDHPDDDAFKDSCRTAIENTAGGIVQFPII